MPSFKQSDVENPHFQLPFRFGGINGAAFVNEQDSVEEIIQCIEVLIAYPIGAHRNVPGFGTPDVIFKSSALAPIIPDQLKTAILQWEERAAQDMEGVPILTDELIQELINRVGVSNA
jgi:hypothetical protein